MTGNSTIDFRGREPGRRPYRFTIDDVYAIQNLGILGTSSELLDGVLFMRKAAVPVRFHSMDLPELYAAGIIPAEVETEMIEGVIYHVD